MIMCQILLFLPLVTAASIISASIGSHLCSRGPPSNSAHPRAIQSGEKPGTQGAQFGIAATASPRSSGSLNLLATLYRRYTTLRSFNLAC